MVYQHFPKSYDCDDFLKTTYACMQVVVSMILCNGDPDVQYNTDDIILFIAW